MAGKKKGQKKNLSEKTVLSSEQEESLKGILEKPEDLNPANIKELITNSHMARELVERIGLEQPGIIDLLLLIEGSFDDKKVVRAVKKVLFRLKQKGVTIPERADAEKPLYVPIKQDAGPPEVFVGAVDAEGGQAIMLMIPDPYRGIDVNIGAVKHREGMEFFMRNTCGRKKSLEMKKFFAEQNIAVVDTSLSHVFTLLENAFRKNETKAAESSEDYLKLRPWLLENSKLLEEPVIYEFIKKEDVSEADLSEGSLTTLFENDITGAWLLEEDELNGVVKKMADADESVILVSEVRKEDRIEEIKKEALSELFPAEKRLLLKNMLEENAYVFYRLDEKENARTCLAAARELENENSEKNLFLMALLEMNLAIFLSLDDEDDQLSV